MNRILFDRPNKQKAAVLCLLVLIGLISSVTTLFTDLHFSLKIILQIIFIGGVLIYVIKSALAKNYVQHNSQSILIRINSLIGESVKFNEILSADLENDTLRLRKRDKSILTFDLSAIDSHDARRLRALIEMHSLENSK